MEVEVEVEELRAGELSRAEAELEVWLGVRELLAEKEHWTQGCGARDAAGKRVTFNDESATCWCVVGAICKVRQSRALVMLQTQKGLDVHVSIWNDRKERKHEDVLKYLDERIRLARVAVEKEDE